MRGKANKTSLFLVLLIFLVGRGSAFLQGQHIQENKKMRQRPGPPWTGPPPPRKDPPPLFGNGPPPMHNFSSMLSPEVISLFRSGEMKGFGFFFFFFFDVF